MPELPEVESMVRNLRVWIGPAARIVEISILRGDRYLPGQEQHDLAGAVIEGVFRRGKFIVFKTDRGMLVCHNAMSGFWDTEDEPWTFDYVEGSRKATESDVRVRMGIHTTSKDRPAATLRFHDARLFGSLRFYMGDDEKQIKSLRSLGPEAIRTECALLPDFNWSVLDLCLFGGVKKPVKQLLMEQEYVAGIGNIYASEGLWRAGIDPFKLGKDLTSKDLAAIHTGVQDVMTDAITFGLDYSKYLKVYRKESCSRCQRLITRQELKGRSTYFCATCQS